MQKEAGSSLHLHAFSFPTPPCTSPGMALVPRDFSTEGDVEEGGGALVIRSEILPTELWKKIIGYFPLKERYPLARVCTTWYQICTLFEKEYVRRTPALQKVPFFVTPMSFVVSSTGNALWALEEGAPSELVMQSAVDSGQAPLISTLINKGCAITGDLMERALANNNPAIYELLLARGGRPTPDAILELSKLSEEVLSDNLFRVSLTCFYDGMQPTEPDVSSGYKETLCASLIRRGRVELIKFLFTFKPTGAAVWAEELLRSAFEFLHLFNYAILRNDPEILAFFLLVNDDRKIIQDSDVAQATSEAIFHDAAKCYALLRPRLVHETPQTANDILEEIDYLIRQRKNKIVAYLFADAPWERMGIVGKHVKAAIDFPRCKQLIKAALSQQNVELVILLGERGLVKEEDAIDDVFGRNPRHLQMKVNMMLELNDAGWPVELQSLAYSCKRWEWSVHPLLSVRVAELITDWSDDALENVYRGSILGQPEKCISDFMYCVELFKPEAVHRWKRQIEADNKESEA